MIVSLAKLVSKEDPNPTKLRGILVMFLFPVRWELKIAREKKTKNPMFFFPDGGSLRIRNIFVTL